MTTITFVHPDGKRTRVLAEPGQSVMEVGTMHGIGEIVAQCGGSQACATCHVFVGEADFAALPPRAALEDELLDATATPRRATSRLSCQLDADHDMTILLPERQM